MLSFGGGHTENLVGGLDQLAGEGNPLGLITVEQFLGRILFQHRRELPGQVDGIADPGVHALAARGAVNMRRIAEQQGAALTEVVRSPGDARDRSENQFTCSIWIFRCSMARPLTSAKVSASACLARSSRTVPMRRDPTLALQWEDARKSASSRSILTSPLTEGPDASRVGNIEDLVVGAARESGAHRLADG